MINFKSCQCRVIIVCPGDIQFFVGGVDADDGEIIVPGAAADEDRVVVFAFNRFKDCRPVRMAGNMQVDLAFIKQGRPLPSAVQRAVCIA